MTLELEASTAQRLQELARSSGRSPTEVLREALEVYSARGTSRPAIHGLGAYHSGRGDVSERAEELLRRAAQARKAD